MTQRNQQVGPHTDTADFEKACAQLWGERASLREEFGGRKADFMAYARAIGTGRVHQTKGGTVTKHAPKGKDGV